MEDFYHSLGWACIWVSLGVMFGLGNHGFNFITIHKHYHKKED
jgi:hypothetical protein